MTEGGRDVERGGETFFFGFKKKTHLVNRLTHKSQNSVEFWPF